METEAFEWPGSSSAPPVFVDWRAARVRRYLPQFTADRKLPPPGRFYQLYLISRFGSDFWSFAPAAGVDEDPVTGSAHCGLADYWGRKLDKTVLIGYQASARGGIVHVMIQDNRVILSGDGIIVAEGELLVG